MDMDRYFPEEYVRELNGLYELVRQTGHQDDLTLSMIVGMNMMYEWTSLCTSIVAEDPNGIMYHGRNMDWSFEGLSFWNLTVFADYQRGGVTVYSGITWAGYVGLLTAMNNGFSITVDQREKFQPDGIRGNLEAIMNGASLVSFLVRDTVANNKTFSDAVPTLANTPLAAPVYLIVGGRNKDEGAVVTRNRTKAVDVWKYGVPDVRCADWYLAQTNYDHWEPDPKTDPRQTEAIAALNSLGRANLNPTSLFNNVMQTPDVLNNSTQYTVIISLAQNYSKGYGWQ
jgi:N-acylethanolamine-hydrolysing acid amidase